MTASLSVTTFFLTSSRFRRLAAILTACGFLAPVASFAQAPKQQVRLMDYFYPRNFHAHWDYVTEKEKGGVKVTRVTMNSGGQRFKTYGIKGGKVVEKYRNVTWMTTVRGRVSDNGLKFGSTLESYDFYGSRDNYAIYGFYNSDGNLSIRTDVVFPERFSPMESVSVKEPLFNSEGGRGPDAVFTTQLIGKESVTVPAGTFTDCIHLRFTLAMKGVPSESAEEWWAKGVGIVKTSRPKAKGGAFVGELHAYELPYEVKLDFYKSRGDFGRVYADKTGQSIYSRKTLAFRVVNHGKTTIPGVDIRIFGSKRFTCDRESTGELAPGEMAEFFITFAPWDFIEYNALLQVEESGNPQNRRTLMLHGIGDI